MSDTIKTILKAAIGAALLAFLVSLQSSLTKQDARLEQLKAEIQVQSGMIAEIQTGSVDTGAVETGAVDTGIVAETVVEQVSVICEPGEQPKNHATDYSGNTQILNTWAVKHNCIFASGTVGDTITFNLAQPTTRDNQVHVWFKGLNAYGRLVSQKGDQVISFPLNAVQTYQQGTGKKSTLDLAKALSKDVTLQTYVAIFDGNYIQSIEIK